jgi:hypothetical protein
MGLFDILDPLNIFGGDEATYIPPSFPRDTVSEGYAQDFLPQIRAMLESSYSRAGALTQERGEAGIQGAREARREVDLVGRGTRRDIMDESTRAGASASSDMANRGLGNTTVAQNAQRSVATDTSRNLTALDSALASLYADLDIAEADAEQQMLGELANIEAAQNQAMFEQYWSPNLGVFAGYGPGPSGTMTQPQLIQEQGPDLGGLAAMLALAI